MINANELRIGNWIYSNQTLMHPNISANPSLVHVTSINTDKIGAIQHNFEYRVEPFEDDIMVKKFPDFIPGELEAIPITDEWLQNFGFEKNGDGNWLSEEKNNLQIKIPGNLIFIFEPASSIQIRTVHQLQNLYFALTAQELDLKE